jgi:DNA polymerase III delta subunit
MQLAGINFYFIKNYKAQANNFSASQVAKIFKLLLNADFHLKSSYQTPLLVMQLLIYNIVRI